MSSAQLWRNSSPVQPIDHRIYASQCPECGKLHYPWVMVCKQCGYRRYPEETTELFWKKRGYKAWLKVPVEGPCKLLTWTRLWNLPLGFDQLNLDLAIVELDNGLRATGQLAVDTPRTGMKLVATPGVVRRYPTHDVWGLRFVAP
jgi:hypothetical protein